MKNLSLEDLSKLWSIFFQIPYFLSVAYEASAVLIEGDETPRQALPVLERNVYVKTFREPVIDEITPEGGSAGDPIISGSKITVRGRNLKGDGTAVLIDGNDIAPDGVSNDVIECTLPTTLYASIHALQISHKTLMGRKGDEKPHGGIESRSATFILTPQITGISTVGGGNPLLDITCDPGVKLGQRVLLLLNLSGSLKAYSLTPEPFADGATTISFKTGAVDAGTYLTRIQVDGAESRLQMDTTTGKFKSPTATVS
jgi:hypothetical protein